jgi:hypothetical protein
MGASDVKARRFHQKRSRIFFFASYEKLLLTTSQKVGIVWYDEWSPFSIYLRFLDIDRTISFRSNNTTSTMYYSRIAALITLVATASAFTVPAFVSPSQHAAASKLGMSAVEETVTQTQIRYVPANLAALSKTLSSPRLIHI